MDLKFERDTSIDNMAESLFERMQKLMNKNRIDDSIAICEEWLVDGKDPQDEDTEFIFMNNLFV